MEQLVLELAPAPEPTLDNYHAGGNAPILLALRAVLQEGNGVLFLWGSPGCGKTHLLRAAVHAARQRGMHSQFLRAHDTAIANGPGLLAVDDVEKLDGSAQSALFDAYNRMRSSGGMILGAGRHPPTDLALREDLRTRVASGVVMQMRPLTEAQKHAVLMAHASQRGLVLATDIVDYLLAHFARDLGSLIAAIDAMDRYSLRTKRAITLPLLRQSMQSNMQSNIGDQVPARDNKAIQ